MPRRTFAIFLITGVFVLLSAFVLIRPKQTEATLIVWQGEAIVIREGGLLSGPVQNLVPVTEVMMVRAGDEIRLGAAAAAQLRLDDGSTVDLAENTTLQITDLKTTSETYVVRLNLLVGKLVSRVERILGSGDAFDIRTPSSTASVRGTVFTVEVIAAHVTYIACAEGVVAVQMGEASAQVPAGNELTATVGQPLQVFPQTGQPPAIMPAPLVPTSPALIPQMNPTETPVMVVPTNGLGSTPSPVNSTPVNPVPSPSGLPLFTPTSQPLVTVANPPTPQPVNPSTPTGVPANVPTLTGTPLPSVVPTNSPTMVPTSVPTTLPTATFIPTATPEPSPTTGGNQTITICHFPPGNPNNAHTITILMEELPGHLAHGDTIGPCPTPTPE